MKTIKKLAVVFSAMLGVAACNKADVRNQDADPGIQLTFKAWFGSDDDATKTIRESDGKVYWVSGDEISMFRGSTSATGGYKFTSSKNSEGATDASGNFELANFSGTIPSTLTSGTYFGLYPYDADATCDGTYITTTLPATQIAAEETFANKLFISIGRSSSEEMAFYNLCGGIKFTLTQSGIKQISIKGKNNENLAGKVKVSINSANQPVVSEVVSGEKEIILTTSDGSAFQTGKAYYFVCLPTAIESGFEITLRKDTQYAKFDYDNSAGHTIRRSVFGSLTGIDNGLTWNGGINFNDPAFKAALLAQTTVDTDSDGEISTTEAAALTTMNMVFSDASVTDCSEMTYFTGLTTLSWECDAASPSALDLSKCTKLTDVTILAKGGALDFDLSNCTKITTLKLENQHQTADIDFTKFTSLKYVELNGKYKTVDLSSCLMKYSDTGSGYYIHNSTIETLNLSNIMPPCGDGTNYDLTTSTIGTLKANNSDASDGHFNPTSCGITTIDFSSSDYFLGFVVENDTALKNVTISCPGINTVTITGCTSLASLDLSGISFPSTGYSFIVNVKNNALTSLTLPTTSSNVDFCTIDCSGNLLTTLNIRSLYTVNRLDCSPMNDASGNNTLATLYVTASQNNIEGVTKDGVRDPEKIPEETEIISTSGSIDTTSDESW